MFKHLKVLLGIGCLSVFPAERLSRRINGFFLVKLSWLKLGFVVFHVTMDLYVGLHVM